MHKVIKRFQVEGVIDDDASFPRLRAHYESLVICSMRDDGYVPVFDLGPYFSTEYNSSRQYNFLITAYGVYVGRRKAWTIDGIVNGQLIQRATQKSKSKE